VGTTVLFMVDSLLWSIKPGSLRNVFLHTCPLLLFVACIIKWHDQTDSQQTALSVTLRLVSGVQQLLIKTNLNHCQWNLYTKYLLTLQLFLTRYLICWFCYLIFWTCYLTNVHSIPATGVLFMYMVKLSSVEFQNLCKIMGLQDQFLFYSWYRYCLQFSLQQVKIISTVYSNFMLYHEEFHVWRHPELQNADSVKCQYEYTL
jgi:hypothetical protein